MPNIIDDYLIKLNETIKTLDTAAISKTLEAIKTARDTGKQVFVIGNGGSAATASHLATDLQKGLRLCTGKRLKAIALTDSIGLITAWGNDYSYDDIFSGQIESLADAGDVLIAISASGNSSNILKAVNTANELGLQTIGWSGYDGGKLASIVDIPVVVLNDNMQRIEDIHLIIAHVIFTCLISE